MARMYPDARTAVEMKEPAMKLTMVIESSQDRLFGSQLIPLLANKPLAEILQEPFVAQPAAAACSSAISALSPF